MKVQAVVLKLTQALMGNKESTHSIKFAWPKAEMTSVSLSIDNILPYGYATHKCHPSPTTFRTPDILNAKFTDKATPLNLTCLQMLSRLVLSLYNQYQCTQ